MGKILTITGYAESGRHRLVRRLIREHEGVRLIESVTTRAPSDSDIPGMYRHINELQFTLLEWAGKLLWGVQYRGLRDQWFRFGTPREEIERILKDEDAIGIMLLKPESVEDLWRYLKGIGKVDVLIPVFLVAPPEDIHRRRLRSRGASPATITRALHMAKSWEERARVAKENERGVPFHFIPNDGRISVTARAVNALLE